MSWLGALAGGVGGASQGFSQAAPFVMGQMQDRQQFGQLQAQRQAEQAGLQQYRDQSIALDEKNSGWERALDRRRAMYERARTETDRIRAENERTRLQMASRDDPAREAWQARVARATRDLREGSEITDPAERDAWARRRGWKGGWADIGAVAETDGNQGAYQPPSQAHYQQQGRAGAMEGYPAGFAGPPNPQGPPAPPVGGVAGSGDPEIDEILRELSGGI